MKKIDSDALGILTKSLGLTGAGSQVTELMDGVVDQVLDIGPCVRRGRTQAGTGGIYTARTRNTHTDAEAKTSTISPFNPVTTRIAPYPLVMPDRFDIYLIDAQVSHISGSTATISAALHLNYPAIMMGISGVGPATAAIATHTLAHWDALVTENVTFAVLAGDNGTRVIPMLRLPRSLTTALVFATTSVLTAAFQLEITLGVFPIALGQDVVG